jgi:hypothetical protein
VSEELVSRLADGRHGSPALLAAATHIHWKGLPDSRMRSGYCSDTVLLLRLGVDLSVARRQAWLGLESSARPAPPSSIASRQNHRTGWSPGLRWRRETAPSLRRVQLGVGLGRLDILGKLQPQGVQLGQPRIQVPLEVVQPPSADGRSRGPGAQEWNGYCA